jgi:hypothetical protein
MTLVTLSEVSHDGIVYKAGEVIRDITEEAAKILIEAGAVVKKDGEWVADQVEQTQPAQTPPTDQAPQTTENQISTDINQVQ